MRSWNGWGHPKTAQRSSQATGKHTAEPRRSTATITRLDPAFCHPTSCECSTGSPTCLTRRDRVALEPLTQLRWSGLGFWPWKTSRAHCPPPTARCPLCRPQLPSRTSWRGLASTSLTPSSLTSSPCYAWQSRITPAASVPAVLLNG